MANQIRVYLYYCPFPTCNFRGESRGQYMSHLASHSEENLEDVRQDHRESTLKAIHEGAQQRGLQPRDPAMIDVIKEVTVTPVMERSILKTAPVVQHQTERFTGNVNRNVFQAPQMYDHDYTLSRNTKVPPSLISHVSQAAEHLYSTEKLLLQTLTAEQNKTILEIFGQLHGFMPYEDLYDVFFMFSVRVGDQLFYHFIEGGKTFGFLHNSQSMPTPTAYYRQHTQEELKNAKELKDFQHARKLCLIDKRVKKLADIDKTVVPGMFMYILKKKKSRKGNDDRYHYQFGFDAEEDGIMKELSGHIESGCKPYPTTYPPTEQLSLQQQYNVLSSLPNDHTASFITRRNTVSYEKDRKKRMECNRAFQDCRPILKDGETVGTRQPIFKPYSFRNRLIHYLKHYDASYISVMLKYHYDGVVPSIVDGRSSVHVEGTSSTNDVLPTVSEESVAPPVDSLAVGVEPMVVDAPVVVVSQPHTSEPSELNSENFLVCQAAVCQIGKCHKRKVSSLDHGKICPHLELMRTNVELWEQFVFPPDMKSSSVEKSFFDVHTQKWDFGGFRKHQPVDEDDPKLLKLRRERWLCAAIAAPLEPAAPNQSKFIEGKDLIPDNPGLCNCASPVLYMKEYEFITNIYYLLYPAKHRVFKLVCSNRRCEILYTGENECIHFHTRETGCAAETGYEFMSYLLESHVEESDDCKLDELLALFDESDEDLSDVECIDHNSSNKCAETSTDNVQEHDSTPSHGGPNARKNSNESGTFCSSVMTSSSGCTLEKESVDSNKHSTSELDNEDADEAEMVALRNKLAALEKKAEMQRRIRALEKELETTPEPSMSSPNRQIKMDKKVEKSRTDVQESSRKNSLGKNLLETQTHVKIKKETDISVKKEKQFTTSRRNITGVDIFSGESTNLPGTSKLSRDSVGRKTETTKSAAIKMVANDLDLGDSDSDWEDLEGEKAFGLNEAGKNIDKLMRKQSETRVAHMPKNPDAAAEQKAKLEKKKRSWTSNVYKDSGRHPSDKKQLSSFKDESDVVCDVFSGISIVKPLITSTTMKSHMVGKKMVKISTIPSKPASELQPDWVTIGVIVSKSDPKVSQKGKQYSFWTLSDLQNCEQTVKFFLFGEVHQKHWKQSTGTVIGILNANRMENGEQYQNKSQNTGMTVDHPAMVMIIGTSKDLSYCKGKTKNFNQCYQHINKTQGDFCSYHVRSAYKKQSAKRAELNSVMTGSEPKSFMKALCKKPNESYMYGGQTISTASSSIF